MIDIALTIFVIGAALWTADGIRWAINEPTAFKEDAE